MYWFPSLCNVLGRVWNCAGVIPILVMLDGLQYHNDDHKRHEHCSVSLWISGDRWIMKQGQITHMEDKNKYFQNMFLECALSIAPCSSYESWL
jgi:hypothetical protein